MDTLDRLGRLRPDPARFRRAVLPVAVWLLAASASLYLLTDRARRYEFVGIAHSRDHTVSAAVTGTIVSLSTDLYQSVEEGSVLARLDDGGVLAGIGVSQATVRQLQAQLEAIGAQLDLQRRQGLNDHAADLRRFQIDEERHRLDMMTLRAAIAEDVIELERLTLEARRFESLLTERLISQLEFDNAHLAARQVAARIEAQRDQLDLMEKEADRLDLRRRGFEGGSAIAPQEVPLFGPFLRAVEVERRHQNELEWQLRAMTLRAPVAGTVSRLVCREGQSVREGDPILVVTEPLVREIVVYLREGDRLTVRPADPAEVSSRSRPELSAESRVTRLGPTVEMLPQPLWRDPALPEFGRGIMIDAVPLLRLTPGELVSVRFPTSGNHRE